MEFKISVENIIKIIKYLSKSVRKNRRDEICTEAKTISFDQRVSLRMKKVLPSWTCTVMVLKDECEVPEEDRGFFSIIIIIEALL